MIDMNAEDAAITITIPGSFDAHYAKDIKEEFSSIAEASDRDIILDLGRCEFIDSSGIGAIIFLHKRLCCKGYQLILKNVQQQPKELLELLRIDKILCLK